MYILLISKDSFYLTKKDFGLRGQEWEEGNFGGFIKGIQMKKKKK